MFTDDSGCEHNVERYFQMGGWHIVQCECGDRFKAGTEKKAMQDQYQHALAKVRVPF